MRALPEPSLRRTRTSRAARALLGTAVASLLWMGIVPDAHAQSSGGRFGLGLIVGDPTGFTGKYFLSEDYAIDGAIGLGLLSGEELRAQAHVLWHLDIKRWPGTAALDLYLGVGPRLGLGDDRFLIGGRAPLGFALMFEKVPVEVFVEAALGLWIVEKLGVDLDLAAGARYYF